MSHTKLSHTNSLLVALLLGLCVFAPACSGEQADDPRGAPSGAANSESPSRSSDALAVPDIPLAEMQYEDIAAKFSISVEMEFPAESPYGSFHGATATGAELAAYREMFVTEFGRYPAEFIAATGLERIVLCKDLAVGQQLRAAIPDFGGQTLYLDCVRGNHAPDYQRRVIHHDYYHMIDYVDDGLYDKDDAWTALNPPEFSYGDGGSSVQGDSRQSLTTDSNPGFFTYYSLSAIEEDKAEIFSHLMINPERLLQQAEQDPTLAAKVDLLKQQLEEFCPAMDEAFWHQGALAQVP